MRRGGEGWWIAGIDGEGGEVVVLGSDERFVERSYGVEDCAGHFVAGDEVVVVGVYGGVMVGVCED